MLVCLYMIQNIQIEHILKHLEKPHHIGACGFESKGFRTTNYIEEEFVFPDTLFPLLNAIEKKEHKKTKGGGGSVTGEIERRPLSGLKEVYYMMQSYDINDEYNGYKIRDIIADERTYEYYQNGIEGYKIVECNFYQYKSEVLTIYMNYPMFPNVKQNLILEFYDEELFKKNDSKNARKKARRFSSCLW